MMLVPFPWRPSRWQISSCGSAALMRLTAASAASASSTGTPMPIFGTDGRPVAALSVAALTERITTREEALAAALKRETAECEGAWRHGPQNGNSHRSTKANGIALQADARR